MSSLNTDPRGCCRREESTFHSSFQPVQPGREMLPTLKCREKCGQAGLVPASIMLGKQSAPSHTACWSFSIPRTAVSFLLSPRGHILGLQSPQAQVLPSHTHLQTLQAVSGSCRGWGDCPHLHVDTQVCTCSYACYCVPHGTLQQWR